MRHPAMLTRALRNDRVQCTACEHWCTLAPGETGLCSVRRNDNGVLHLLVYGRAIAAHVDPIEKKPLHHFLPTLPIYSIGTVGCNFRCAWCQNWEISQLRDIDSESPTLGQRLAPDEIVRRCTADNIPMVAFTYNEPVVYFEYAYDTAVAAQNAGLRTVFVSSGYETLAAIDTIAPYLDAINLDLKAFRDETYRDLCGARIAPVLRNIEHIASDTDIWIEVTTLVIPDLNDSDKELRDIASFLASIDANIPWHVSGFVPHFQMHDRPPTSAATLRKAWEIGRDAGLNYVYTGNIWGDHRLQGCADTHCPRCGCRLIQRHGYQVEQLWSRPGVCPECDTAIAGVWV